MSRVHNWSPRNVKGRQALAVLLLHLTGAPCPKCSFDDYVHCDLCGNGSGSGSYYDRDFTDMRGGHRHGEVGGTTSVTLRLPPRILTRVDQLVEAGGGKRPEVLRKLLEEALDRMAA